VTDPRDPTRLVLLVWLLLLPQPLAAQGVDGYASVMADAVPGAETAELRARVLAERRVDLGARVRLTAAGFVEGLVADRGRFGTRTDAVLRARELHAEVLWPRADLRVGLSRVVWGRLDELLPTDVVNPLDLTRFLFEGRAEARLAVPMVRARLLPGEAFSLDAVYVPIFTRARFDDLDEASSPFAIAPPLPAVRREPPRTLRNAQGGVRATATTGRVDWALTAYRGFEPLPEYVSEAGAISERYPRFTLVGADFETVRGRWGIRGELARRGESVEGGAGLDRPAGEYRFASHLLVARRRGDTDLSLVGSIERSWARATRSLRAFAVYNASEGSLFARAVATLSLRDHVGLELSGGAFAGRGDDVLGRLTSRDFLYVRLKVFY
jgi:hypothetical protein